MAPLAGYGVLQIPDALDATRVPWREKEAKFT
jgi:hypothetical protein